MKGAYLGEDRVTESVAYQWIRGFIFTKDIIEGTEKFTKCSFDRNYQHKDSTDSRIKKDAESLKKIEEFFTQYNPFPDSVENLINIANGISASKECNCHNVFEEGVKIMQEIAGQNLKDLKLSRSKIVKTITSGNSTINIDNKKIEINPDVLFHRICIVKKADEEMNDYLKWELSPFPQALFNTYGMLKNTKSDLYNVFQEIHINVRDPVNTHYVIDGGFLIHKVKWITDQVFSAIMNNYISHIRNNYSTNCTVIFDGYEKRTIKQSERHRRAKFSTSAEVHFTENMPLRISQEKFLANSKNKNNIIKMLRRKLMENGIQSTQCAADADRTIVTTAIDIAKNTQKKVVIVAEDTDILVLTTALTPSNLEIYLLKPSRLTVPEKTYSSRSLDNLPIVLDNILLLHAITGCDTVSATFNQGKLKFVKTFQR